MSEWIIEAESLEEIPDGNWTIGRKLVRCEDCKWCAHFTDGHIECRLLYGLKPVPRTYMQMREDDYCSYGEKVIE